MKEKIEKLLQSKYGSTALVAVGMVGVLLIGFGDKLTSPVKETTNAPSTAVPESGSFVKDTEQRLEQLLGAMEGAGKTYVMITVEGSGEEIYAMDIEKGGSDRYEQKHVLLSNGSALTEYTRTPVISGVAVVCEGGGNVAVAARMTELLSALLDLPTNRISIQKAS